MANFSIPILPVSTVSGNQWRQRRIFEDASQTFKSGTPIEIYTTGGVKVWDGTTVAAGIAGISYEAASNLSTLGGATVPWVQPLQPFGGPGAVAGTFGSVPNEASAVNIAHGAPLNDGRCGFNAATGDTVFSAAFGTTGVATTPLITDVGVDYCLTLDSNGYWYVDKAKTGAGSCLTVVGLDPRDVPAPGSRVLFTFMATAAQLVA